MCVKFKIFMRYKKLVPSVVLNRIDSLVVEQWLEDEINVYKLLGIFCRKRVHS